MSEKLICRKCGQVGRILPNEMLCAWCFMEEPKSEYPRRNKLSKIREYVEDLPCTSIVRVHDIQRIFCLDYMAAYDALANLAGENGLLSIFGGTHTFMRNNAKTPKFTFEWTPIKNDEGVFRCREHRHISVYPAPTTLKPKMDWVAINQVNGTIIGGENPDSLVRTLLVKEIVKEGTPNDE